MSLVLAAVSAAAVGVALVVWRPGADGVVAHAHPELAPEHSHLAESRGTPAAQAHPLVIDELIYGGRQALKGCWHG